MREGKQYWSGVPQQLHVFEQVAPYFASNSCRSPRVEQGEHLQSYGHYLAVANGTRVQP